MNKCPKISVIVPIYNAEKTLQRCVESILTQTFGDFELLLINDGSSDASGDICNNYAEQDLRVKVIHQDNKGIGETRQVGILEAQGVYSIHVDPDDWIEADMLEKMLGKAEASQSDVVIANYYVQGDEFCYIDQQFRFANQNKADFLIRKIVSGELHGAYWNKLIKHAIYGEVNVQFPPLNFCEDQLVFLQLLLGGARCAFIDEAFYHYIQHSNSQTHQLGADFIELKLKPYHQWLRELVAPLDMNLYNTNQFFFYDYLSSENVPSEWIAYLAPPDIGVLKRSYLSIERKIGVLKRIKAPRYYLMIITIKYVWLKIKRKIWYLK